MRTLMLVLGLAVSAVAIADARAPTAEEMETHRATHLPYRSWCEDCVMGRGSGERHRSGPAGKRSS